MIIAFLCFACDDSGPKKAPDTDTATDGECTDDTCPAATDADSDADSDGDSDPDSDGDSDPDAVVDPTLAEHILQYYPPCDANDQCPDNGSCSTTFIQGRFYSVCNPVVQDAGSCPLADAIEVQAEMLWSEAYVCSLPCTGSCPTSGMECLTVMTSRCAWPL
jgi:hypothetical protein